MQVVKRRSPGPDNRKKAFIYLRVSTLRQATEGVSLNAQEARCRALASQSGLTVSEVCQDEGVSGKDNIEHRPGLRHLLKAVRENPGSRVLVYSISRLARRQRLLWHLLDERDGEGLAVTSATEPFDTSTPMGRAMLGMIGVWSQLEADMISERTKDALAEAKAQGTQLGNRGFAEHPEIVATIVEMHDKHGMSIREIAATLNNDGVLTPKGKLWSHDSVHRALKAAKPA